MGKQRPLWTRFLAVSVVIEGFDFAASAEPVRAELNRVAPYAYTRGTRLGSIWSRLTPETQRALETGWQREKEGAVIPRARKAAS